MDKCDRNDRFTLFTVDLFYHHDAPYLHLFYFSLFYFENVVAYGLTTYAGIDLLCRDPFEYFWNIKIQLKFNNVCEGMTKMLLPSRSPENHPEILTGSELKVKHSHWYLSSFVIKLFRFHAPTEHFFLTNSLLFSSPTTKMSLLSFSDFQSSLLKTFSCAQFNIHCLLHYFTSMNKHKEKKKQINANKNIEYPFHFC